MKYSFYVLSFFVIPFSLQAATIHFEPQDSSAGIGTPFAIAVTADSEIPTNAFSLAIYIPESLSPIDVHDGNSIISMWVEHPAFDETTRLLTFSGIVPNGYVGTGARLVTIMVTPTKPDPGAVLKLAPASAAYANEGESVVLLSTPLVLPIVTSKENLDVAQLDRHPPEIFVPVVTRDPNLADGRRVVVFSTTDKGSGIAGYAVRERLFGIGWGTFKPVQSPYVLRDQYGFSSIEVRATDKAGQWYTAYLAPERTIPMWVVGMGVAALMLLCAYGIWHVRNRFK